MKIHLHVQPTTQSIHFIDHMMQQFVEDYQLSCAKEICFVAHELLINAVEAAPIQNALIEFKLILEHTSLHIMVINDGVGISKHQQQLILQNTHREPSLEERGHGFYFIQHMVDDLWFEQLQSQQFLVGITKNLE